MARIQGNEGKITGTSFNAYVTRWTARHSKRRFEVTPMPSVNSPFFVCSTFQFLEGSIEFPIDSAIATSALIPAGTQVQLTLGIQGTSKQWVFNAIITDIDIEVQSTNGGPPEMARASWVRSDSTDTAIAST